MELARSGFAIGINYLTSEEPAQQLKNELDDMLVNSVLLQADISDEPQVEAMFAQLDASFGRLTALVNNAGVLDVQGSLLDLNAQRINRLLQTNVTGSMLCAREAVKRMSTAQGGAGGSIVNVSSVAARTGSPNEYLDYAASKGAIDTFTKGLASEVAGQGIRVNAVRPGFIHTQMHADGGEPNRVERLASSIPMQRGGLPEEVASAIRFLISEQAAYISGSIVDVAGGR